VRDPEGGDTQCPESQRRPIDHHASGHDGDHDEGTLGGCSGSGEHQIKGCAEQRDRGGPFLDRLTACQRGDQSKPAANEKEYDPGHHRHMKPGNRQHVDEAGDVESVFHRGRNLAALAGDDRRGDGALVAGNDGADALVDAVAHRLDDRGVAQPCAAARCRRRRGLDPAEHEAGGAERGKIHVAREIVTAGPQRRKRRQEIRFERYERSDRWRGSRT
jgi:hypothetical protein